MSQNRIRAWLAVLVTAALAVGACGPGSTPAPKTVTVTAGTSGADEWPLRPKDENGQRWLPIGDGKVTVERAARGWVYACPDYAASFRKFGDLNPDAWFSKDRKWYAPGLKPKVPGDNHHDGQLDVSTSPPQRVRVIRSNDLPINHGAGDFPIKPGSPASKYDDNPNGVAAQDITITVPLDPQPAATPSCMGNMAGVMTTSGVMMFNGLDAGGRDAGAWEMQDSCSGHPAPGDMYHYHTGSSCTPKGQPADRVLGWALDGYPITGNRMPDGRELVTADLDECHGTVGEVEIDGERRRTYQYPITPDYPYTVSCFKGTPGTRR